MRTKALLLTAAFAAAGVAAASAQVYSVNAVGYVNVSVPKGFSMIANPLKASANTVGALLASAPDGTTVYKFSGGKFGVNTKDFGEFANGAETMNPGEGAFIEASSAFTVTFVGEVPQGALSQNIPAGFSIQASQVPQKGQLDTVLKFPAADGDTVYRYNNGSGRYSIHAYDFGAWDNPPSPEVGEAFFVNKAAAAQWKRDFSVNN
ncbi:MAG: hypothetical protein FJ404_10415 [Verrucomicrobia bacterium]|nr:hypothetical protein [Verrucomicrobiota bacterium]